MANKLSPAMTRYLEAIRRLHAWQAEHPGDQFSADEDALLDEANRAWRALTEREARMVQALTAAPKQQ